MNNLKHIEDYFIKLHRSFGISELSYQNRRLELDESYMKQLVFASEAFDEEFENLVDHCSMIYDGFKKLNILLHFGLVNFHRLLYQVRFFCF